MVTEKEIWDQVEAGELTLEDVKKKGWLTSVTGRIKKVKQPRGGFIKPKEFDAIQLPGGGIDDLNPEENVHPSLVGMAVDYLTRFMTGATAREAFAIAEMGTDILGEGELFKKWIGQVQGLDDQSIIAALDLCRFDAVVRAGIMTPPKPLGAPSQATIENVRTMVERSLDFFDEYGPKVMDGLTFEGGYTGYVRSGDGDFMTSDTLWDFKVSKQKLKSAHTLQLLMYWRMGLHSIHPEYQQVKYLGIYNPRQNVVYRLAVDKIPPYVSEVVEKFVIGY